MTQPDRGAAMARVLGVVAAVLLAAACGCARKPNEIELFNGAPLPKPDRVLVYDFEVTPQEVDPAHGVSARTRAAAGGESRTQDEIAAGRAVAAALSERLVATIESLGIDAARAAYPELPSGNDLALRGQFLTVRAGGAAPDVEIGLAGAREQIHVEVQIYQNSLRVEAFEDVAHGPSQDPAAGGSIAAFEHAVDPQSDPSGDAGAVADSPQAAPQFGADPEADASRTAAKLAKPLAAFFLREGWISSMPQ